MSGQETGAAVFVSPTCQVVRSVIWGEPVCFTITNPRDAIQKKHRQGEFYEPEELEIIRAHCLPGSVFCDIGANIGNHTMFALKFLHAARAILFEPNPAAIAILTSNLTLNGLLGRCDLSNLGVGLSDLAHDGLGISAPAKNLGAGRMVEGEGELRVVRGDDALAGTRIDFLKIDVEGMEMQVLAGLQATLKAHRPRIFIEVDKVNRTAFGEWARANDYTVKARFKRYRTNENFLLIPNPASPPTTGTPQP